jgi:glucokinase
LLGPVRERVRAEAMSPAGTIVDVVPAALGDRVGVVGAAAIVIERRLSDLVVDG